MAALLAACPLWLTACAPSKTALVRVNEVTHSVFYAPLYAAINKGYFADEGLDIELVNGGGADKTMTAVLAGQSDIAFCGPEAAIYVYNEGKEDHCVVFGQVTQCDGSFLVGRSADTEFSWEKLRGRTIIGGRAGGVPNMTLCYILRQKGIVPGTDCTVLDNVQFNLMAGAFEGGTGDYVTLFEPTATVIEQEGKGHIVAAVGSELFGVPYTAFAAKKSYLASNSETVERFLKAVYRGQQFVASASDREVAEAIAPSFPTDSVEVLTEVVRRYRGIRAWKTEPAMSQEAFDLLQDIMEAAGELSARAPYAALVDNSFAAKVTK